jgi:hypothetical protein
MPPIAKKMLGIVSGINRNLLILNELIGVAALVVTPLSVGVKNNTLGMRP